VLNSSLEYEKWIFIVRSRALGDDVWKYINPELTTKPLPPQKPILRLDEIQPGAQKLIDIDDDKKVLLAQLRSRYDDEMDEYKREMKVIHQIDKEVITSACENYFEMIEYCTTLYERLKALSDKLNPTNEERELDVRREWDTITREIPSNAPVESWISEVRVILNKCVKLEMPEAAKNRPMNAILDAIKSIDDDAMWSEIERSKYNDKVKDPAMM
jgi:hypothetical protein